jgi:hypothetical protein
MLDKAKLVSFNNPVASVKPAQNDALTGAHQHEISDPLAEYFKSATKRLYAYVYTRKIVKNGLNNGGCMAGGNESNAAGDKKQKTDSCLASRQMRSRRYSKD